MQYNEYTEQAINEPTGNYCAWQTECVGDAFTKGRASGTFLNDRHVVSTCEEETEIGYQ